MERTENLRTTSYIPRNLLAEYQRLLSSQPGRRLNPKKFLDTCEFFQNHLVDFLNFLEQLQLKDTMDKEQFFKRLPKVLEKLNPIFTRHKVRMTI